MKDTLAIPHDAPGPAAPATHAGGRTLDDLVRLARDVTGVDLDARRAELVRAMALAESDGVSALDIAALGLDELYPLVEHLAGEATVKETYFFRAPEQFEMLAAEALPAMRDAALLRHGPAWNVRPRLRIWSAGCSTGEEAYSLAVAVRLAMPRTAGWEIGILATDICETALRAARAALYDAAAAERRCAGPWDEHSDEWFEQLPDGGFRVREETARLVRFERHNVLRDDLPTDMDVIFCRNVMVYFDAADQALLVDRLWHALRPGGLLFLGDAEFLHLLPNHFEAVPGGEVIAYRKPGEPS